MGGSNEEKPPNDKKDIPGTNNPINALADENIRRLMDQINKDVESGKGFSKVDLDPYQDDLDFLKFLRSVFLLGMIFLGSNFLGVGEPVCYSPAIFKNAASLVKLATTKCEVKGHMGIDGLISYSMKEKPLLAIKMLLLGLPVYLAILCLDRSSKVKKSEVELEEELAKINYVFDKTDEEIFKDFDKIIEKVNARDEKELIMYGNQWSTFKYINLIRLSLIFSLSFVYVVFFKLFIHRKHYNTLFLCYDFLTNALLRYTFIVDGFMSLVVHCSSDVTIAFSNEMTTVPLRCVVPDNISYTLVLALWQIYAIFIICVMAIRIFMDAVFLFRVCSKKKDSKDYQIEMVRKLLRRLIMRRTWFFEQKNEVGCLLYPSRKKDSSEKDSSKYNSSPPKGSVLTPTNTQTVT